MPSQICPSCNAETNVLIFLPCLRGENPRICCGQCRHRHSTTTRDRKLYTGKKFWVEEDVYTRDQVKEKNHEFEKSVKQQVAQQHRTMRPSTRKKLYGE